MIQLQTRPQALLARGAILQEIVGERSTDDQVGGWETDYWSEREWLSAIARLSEDAWFEHYPKCRSRFVSIAALALGAVETLDRYVKEEVWAYGGAD